MRTLPTLHQSQNLNVKPISVRFNPNERALLEQRTGKRALSPYLRECALCIDVSVRKSRGTNPAKDHVALEKVLSTLGRSNLARDLDTLAWSVEDGMLHLSEQDPKTTRLRQSLWRIDMILVGNQCSGGRNHANHLMKDENVRTSVHDLRGFASTDLHSAFKESYAISRATKCQQHLYSLSLNSPKGEEVSSDLI